MENINLSKMVKSIPEDWPIEKKIRKIYISVLDSFAYNGKYGSNESEEREIYAENITISSIDNLNTNKRIIGICRQISMVLSEAFNLAGIESFIVGESFERKAHVDVIIKVGDRYIGFNPYRDLARVQVGCETVRIWIGD